MGDISLECIADEMYQMVLETRKAKILTPSDLVNTMVVRHRGSGITRRDCRKALRILIESGRCVYGYFVDTYVTVPQAECALPPAGAEESP